MSSIDIADLTNYIVNNFESDNIKYKSGYDRVDDITVEWYDIYFVKENLIVSYMEHTNSKSINDDYYIEMSLNDKKCLSSDKNKFKIGLENLDYKYFFAIQSLIFSHNKKTSDNIGNIATKKIGKLNSLIRKSKIENILKD